MQQIYKKNSPHIRTNHTNNLEINFNTEDSEYTEPSLALLKLSRLNNTKNISINSINSNNNNMTASSQLNESIPQINKNNTSNILSAREMSKESSNGKDVSLSIGDTNTINNNDNNANKTGIFSNNNNNNNSKNNDPVTTPDLSSVGFSNLESSNKRKYSEYDDVNGSVSSKQLKSSRTATPVIDNHAFNENYDDGDDEDIDTSKLPRATIEQKLAIVEFFTSYKADIPRFKLVNMFNKKISISISSLSSWLKNEKSLIEKYKKKYRCTDLSLFNFRQIIQDLVDSEVPEHRDHPAQQHHLQNGENKGNGSRKGSSQLSSDDTKEIDPNKKSQRAKYHHINKMMDKIVLERKSQNLPINESVLKEYWVKFYPTCGLTDPKRAKGPSNGWLDNFKNKHELKNYDASGFEFDFNRVGLENHKQQQPHQQQQSNNKNNSVEAERSPFGAALVALPENLKKDKARTNNLTSHGSAVSAQSGLYITKPSANETDYEKPLNPQTMGISTSGKIETTLNDDMIRNGNNIVPLTTSASMNVPGNNNSNGDFIPTNIKFLPSHHDLSNHQESTDSFFKKFGSGIFNFNNAGSKDLENVNAFFQQQKQTQQYQAGINGSSFIYHNNNNPNNINDSDLQQPQQANTPKKVESNILWWFKNNSNQQLPISSGLSFFNLSSYNKNQPTSVTPVQKLDTLQNTERSDSKNKEQTHTGSSNEKSVDINRNDIMNKSDSTKPHSPHFTSPEDNISQPTLTHSNKLFSGNTSATGSQVSARFSQILSSNSFKDNISNSIKQLKKTRDHEYNAEKDDDDESDDSDGGLEINVPQNFKQEEIELLMKVHVSNFFKKNKKNYPKSFAKIKELLDTFEAEKISKAEKSLKGRLENKNFTK